MMTSIAAFAAAAKLRAMALPWARILPWVAMVAGIAALLFAVHAHGYRVGVEHERPIAFKDGAKAERKTWLEAQAKADRAAKANQAAKATAHAANNKETTDEAHAAHKAAAGTAAAIRLRIDGIDRAARTGAVPGAGKAASGTDAQVDWRLSLADELALREQCEAIRIDHDALIDWETRRLAIELQPGPVDLLAGAAR